MQNKSLIASWEAVLGLCPCRIPKNEPFGQSFFLYNAGLAYGYVSKSQLQT